MCGFLVLVHYFTLPSFQSRRVARCSQLFASRPEPVMFGSISMYHIDLLNVFGRNGGFHALVNWLESPDLEFWLLWRIISVRETCFVC